MESLASGGSFTLSVYNSLDNAQDLKLPLLFLADDKNRFNSIRQYGNAVSMGTQSV